jgi:flagellar biosynthesis anti-sigma factor FlgM
MNINTNVYKQYVKSGGSTRKIPSYMFSGSEKTSSAKVDTFSLSANASLFRECGKTIKSAANEVAAPADESRIDSLRQQIKNGQYSVSSGDIADSILERIV